MKINYAHLCDYAMEANGKLSVIGIFRVIFAKQFPAKHPMAYLAFELEFASAEIGMKANVEIKVRDSDGGDLAQVKVEVESQGKARPGITPRVHPVVPMHNMLFPKPGSYDFAFFVNGDYKQSIDLELRTLPPGALKKRRK